MNCLLAFLSRVNVLVEVSTTRLKNRKNKTEREREREKKETAKSQPLESSRHVKAPPAPPCSLVLFDSGILVHRQVSSRVAANMEASSFSSEYIIIIIHSFLLFKTAEINGTRKWSGSFSHGTDTEISLIYIYTNAVSIAAAQL